MGKVNILAYGTLKKGCSRDAVQTLGAKYIGKTTIKNKILKILNAGFPIMVDNEGTNVKAEVLSIDKEILPFLDQIEGVDKGLYSRETMYVYIKGNREQVIYYKWKYEVPVISVGDTEEWKEEIVKGSGLNV